MTYRPNILLIVGEDTGCHLGCDGEASAVTPHLDSLASQGLRFSQFFSAAPVCAPARSALVTGQYPQKIGTHHMRSTLLSPPRVFMQELRDAGYHVNWSNKTDFNFDPDTAYADQGGWCDEQSDWRAALAAGNMPRQPWFAYINLSSTHESMMWPAKFAEQTQPFVSSDIPPCQQPAQVNVPPYLPDTPRVREDISRHARNTSYLDVQVGEILSALDQSGQRDKTLVIFLADHGRGMPREKRWPYTAGLHVPLILRWPGVLSAGEVDDRLAAGVDLAPTILSLAGVAIPANYDGIALLGDARSTQENTVIFAGRDRMDEAFDRVRIVRNHRYHYVRNHYPQLPWAQRIGYMETLPTMQELRELHAQGKLTGTTAMFMAASKPAEELYELESDPHCVHNRAADPSLAAVRLEMGAKLDAWEKRVDDLGAIPERQLVAQGLIKDRLTEYRTRIAPLPERYRIGPALTLLEMHEAQAYHA